MVPIPDNLKRLTKQVVSFGSDSLSPEEHEEYVRELEQFLKETEKRGDPKLNFAATVLFNVATVISQAPTPCLTTL